MANRRMFSKKITESARFLKMPSETQALYFHLGMSADDDGVVEAFTIMRLLGATEDSLKILVAKDFVRVLNDDLVTHIIDWNEHNLIRADRKIDSIYKDLLLEVVPEIELLEPKSRKDNEIRNKLYKESSLPDKFMGTIRSLFHGEYCPVCSIEMVQGTNTKPSVQHNKPLSKGGKHDLDNISVICLSCNMSIKNKETSTLNNIEVKKKWKEFSEDSTRTARGQHRVGKDRVGKVSLVEDKLEIKSLSLETSFSESLLNDFIAYRKELKKPIKTARALKAFTNQLLEIQTANIDINYAIDTMKNNEWQTVKLEWIQKHKIDRSNQLPVGANVFDMIDEDY